ncbi:hypothetical protein [Sulfurisphaera tokodaii]|uniref:FoxI protein n=2 Tax=Sulfurisphaera tokodaii TaxID=111955 RepID=Q96XB8_SULTO|nr:hypothetical protein [Sulfurisphaera tokodaii]BAB67710.1 FoxI protein [Sulfurisphaera tokodaii str. 7]HII75444.1 hypothetical protein [Sulfurisphaera tokodaii]
MKINKKVIIFLVAIGIIAVLFSLFIFDRSFAFSIISSQSSNYNYTYGTFTVYIYNPANGIVKKENITGIMLYIDNVDVQNLQITSISNSTFSEVPVYYVQVPVPLPNGSVINGFQRSYEIYIGYEKILIPTTGLSSGSYVIELSDGTTISVTIR